MADDTVEAATARLQVAIGVCIHKRSELSAIQPAIDALIAAVRAENAPRITVETLTGTLQRMRDALRQDDEPILVRYSEQVGKRVMRRRQFAMDFSALWVILKKLLDDPLIGRITVEKQH